MIVAVTVLWILEDRMKSLRILLVCFLQFAASVATAWCPESRVSPTIVKISVLDHELKELEKKLDTTETPKDRSLVKMHIAETYWHIAQSLEHTAYKDDELRAPDGKLLRRALHARYTAVGYLEDALNGPDFNEAATATADLVSIMYELFWKDQAYEALLRYITQVNGKMIESTFLPSAYFLLGNDAWCEDKPQEAMEWYEKIITNHSQSAEYAWALLYSAEAFEELHEYDMAFIYYTDLLAYSLHESTLKGERFQRVTFTPESLQGMQLAYDKFTGQIQYKKIGTEK